MINLGGVPPVSAGQIVDSYEIAFGDPLILSGTGENKNVSFRFPPGTKIGLSQNRIMTATKVPDRSGSIKEMSGFDDWKIDIEFNLVLPVYNDMIQRTDTRIDRVADFLGFQSIIDALKKLHRVWKQDRKLSVLNAKMNALEIEYFVAEQFSIPDNETYHHQPVRLSGLSDTDYELILEGQA